MVFVLIIGLFLLAAAVYMIVRAAIGPEVSTGTTSATLQQIGAYGFSGSEGVGGEPSDRRRLSGLASSIGNRLRNTRLSKGETETRAMLVSAGMYGTTPDRFLGSRVISSVGIGLLLLWLLGISSLSFLWVVVLIIVGVVIGRLVGFDASERFLVRCTNFPTQEPLVAVAMVALGRQDIDREVALSFI